MELFKITCVTCSARLSVRDESVIGQILACPRCGSMVQVTGPAVAASATPSHLTPAIVLPVAAANVFEVADVGASLEEGAADLQPTAAPVAAAAGGGGFKLAAILVAGALAGSAVVAGALTWLTDDAPIVAPVAVVHEGEAQAVAPPAVIESPSDDVRVTDEAPSVDAATDKDQDVQSPVLTTAEETAEAAPASAQAPPLPPQPLGDSEAEAPAAAVVESTNDSPAAVAPAPRLRIDPLEIDPEGLDLSTLFRPRPQEPAPISQVDAEPIAPVDSEAPAEPADAPGALEAVRRDAAGAGGGPGDVAALLARRLPGVKVEKMPLCRFLDLAGQLSGLPVSVDPAQLRLAGASAGAAVSVDAKNASIEEVIAAAVKPLRLAVVVDGSQLAIVRPGSDKRRTTACPVDDLTNGGPTAEELAAWIQRLAAPESWQIDGRLKVAGDVLELEQREDVTYETFILLERYRLARGLPTRTKYPKALLAAGAESAAIAERLGGATTFTFSQYTPLREIFRYWQEELEVAVLVDWPALAGERLWPQTRIAVSVINKPWPEALDSVLAPLGLGWRPAGGRAVQITTLAKVHGDPQVELYRLAPGATATAEDLEKQVQAEMTNDEIRMTNGGTSGESNSSAAVAYDAANRVLLVRAPASVQRRLGEWLKEQRLLDAE